MGIGPTFKLPSSSPPYLRSFGADPEGFLVDSAGRICCPEAFGIKPEGSKLLSADGAQLELHPMAGTCRAYVTDSLRVALFQAKGAAHSQNVTFKIPAAVRTPAMHRKVFSPSALVCGCEPDWSAYTLKNTLSNPPDFRRHPWRYGGGHIHVGLDKRTEWFPAIVLMWDMTAGLFDVIAAPDPLVSARRRRLFGKAGSFREQPWGIEYRTPENSWLRSPKLFYAHTSLVKRALELLGTDQGRALCSKLIPKYGRSVQEIINSCDQKAARVLWADIAPQLEALGGGRNPSTGLFYSMESWISEYPKLLDKYILPNLQPWSEEPDWGAWRLDEENPVFGTINVVHAGFCRGGLDEYLEYYDEAASA